MTLCTSTAFSPPVPFTAKPKRTVTERSIWSKNKLMIYRIASFLWTHCLVLPSIQILAAGATMTDISNSIRFCTDYVQAEFVCVLQSLLAVFLWSLKAKQSWHHVDGRPETRSSTMHSWKVCEREVLEVVLCWSIYWAPCSPPYLPDKCTKLFPPILLWTQRQCLPTCVCVVQKTKHLFPETAAVTGSIPS